MPKNYEANYINEEDYYNEKRRKEKTQELIAHGYALKFDLGDIIEIGIPKSAKTLFIETIKMSFNEQDQKTILHKVRYLTNIIERIKDFFVLH